MKFLTTTVSQLSNQRLVSKVIKSKSEKWRLCAVPKVCICSYTQFWIPEKSDPSLTSAL